MAVIRDEDKGWDRITAELRSLSGKKVRVGVLSSAGDHPDGDITIAEVAAFNEFGTRHIPARPFVSTAFDENLSKYERQLARDVRKATGQGGFMTAETVANRLGLRMQSDIQRKIVSLREPPNAPATIRKKGSSNPLIDTGRMRQSISFEVKG